MANFAMTDCVAWVHNHDFTADSNKLTLKAEVDDLDKTTFGNSYRSRIGGLKDVTANLEGFWQSATSDAVDPVLFGNMGGSDRVCTFAPTSDEESPAFFFNGGVFQYELGDEVGALIPFACDVMGTNRIGLIRGQIAAAPQTVSTDAAFGSAVQLGAASNAVYGVVHVFTAGSTVDIAIESDSASNFPSATTVDTVTITATGSYFLTGSATSDTYYRLTADNSSGSFVLAGAIGVR